MGIKTLKFLSSIASFSLMLNAKGGHYEEYSMWCIKKNGLYLSSKTITHEDDYWEPLEITARMTTGVAWVDDVDLADTFIDRMRAESYLAMKRGDFWRDAVIVQE